MLASGASSSYVAAGSSQPAIFTAHLHLSGNVAYPLCHKKRINRGMDACCSPRPRHVMLTPFCLSLASELEYGSTKAPHFFLYWRYRSSGISCTIVNFTDHSLTDDLIRSSGILAFKFSSNCKLTWATRALVTPMM